MFEENIPGANPTDVSPTSENKPNAGSGNVETTKAFAARLAQEKAKVIKAEREKIAKENGYATYDEFVNATVQAKIRQETVYDPDDPDFNKVVNIVREKGDPEKAILLAEVESYRQAEAERWAAEQVKAIEDTFGVKIKSLDDLDDAVRNKISKGIDPVDAYYLVHKPTITKTEPKDKGDKTHLHPDTTGGASGGAKVPTAEEIKKVRAFLQNDDLTDEQVKELIIKTQGQK